MSNAQGALRYGRVVYAWIKDRRGFGKLRPALVLTPDDLIDDVSPLVVAAITTTFPRPIPSNCVALPWHPRGNVVTRLKAPSAVVLDWQSTIRADDIVGFGGDVPPRLMLAIEKRLDELMGRE